MVCPPFSRRLPNHHPACRLTGMCRYRHNRHPELAKDPGPAGYGEAGIRYGHLQYRFAGDPSFLGMTVSEVSLEP